MADSAALKIHQEIDVKQEKSEGRLKIVRQDRRDVEDLNCFIENIDEKFKVLNVSNFGILINSKEILEWDYKAYSLIVENVDLGKYNLRVVRSYEQGEQILTALEIVGDIINTENIDTIVDAHMIINQHKEFAHKNSNIPDSFARRVYEVKDWLEELQLMVSEFEEKNKGTDPHNAKSFENLVSQIIGEYINVFMPAKNKDVSGNLEGLEKDQLKACYTFFREKLKKLIYQAPFSDRVFNKPLGYAGDFEMMNIIYRSSPEGEGLFAKCLHQYWVKQPAAQAVRNRASYLKDKISNLINTVSKDKVSFLSVACGPAMEWQQLCTELKTTKNIDVTLLDQDDIALKNTQKQLRTINKTKNINFDFMHKAIKNIIARGLDGKYDLIYSAGLFDYFSAPVARLATQKLYDALNPGGQLIIGNFNVDNPNSITMDLALDWNLIYRSEDELLELLHVPNSKISIEKESLNINLFCIIEKP